MHRRFAVSLDVYGYAPRYLNGQLLQMLKLIFHLDLLPGICPSYLVFISPEPHPPSFLHLTHITVEKHPPQHFLIQEAQGYTVIVIPLPRILTGSLQPCTKPAIQFLLGVRRLLGEIQKKQFHQDSGPRLAPYTENCVALYGVDECPCVHKPVPPTAYDTCPPPPGIFSEVPQSAGASCAAPVPPIPAPGDGKLHPKNASGGIVHQIVQVGVHTVLPRFQLGARLGIPLPQVIAMDRPPPLGDTFLA